MNENINYDYYYYYDKPIPYKELLIYPIKVSEYLQFYYAIDCLLINKNRTPDIKVIQMSYLDYIYYKIQEEIRDGDIENAIIINKFLSLMSIVFKINSEQILLGLNESKKAFMLIKEYRMGNEEVSDIQINASEFDEIKKIICSCNCVELPDDSLDPKLEQALEEARKFRDKNNEKMGSLEDQFICIMISTSLKLEEIENLTIRKFYKILERVDYKLHYQLYKTAEMNGAEFKSKIHHWMSEITHDKYAGLLIDYDTTAQKFTK